MARKLLPTGEFGVSARKGAVRLSGHRRGIAIVCFDKKRSEPASAKRSLAFHEEAFVFFHIDESGNTGNQLFDASQPLLSYGVLSSLTNVDALGIPIHKSMCKALGVATLHAAELGIGRLERIASPLLELKKKMNFEFGLYFIEKRTYAIVQLFEAVFDAGLNKAVPWIYYWTPLRFYTIYHLANLVDDDLLRRSWALCIDRNIQRKFPQVQDLLVDLKRRVLDSRFHDRMKEIMADAFDYGINYPDRLDFGFPDDRLVSPNAVGFQLVIGDIARQVRKKKVGRAMAITVDHQQQFNAAQLTTFRHKKTIADSMKVASREDRNFVLQHPLYRHLEKEEILGAGIINQDPVVGRRKASIGLQIADIYLWLINRVRANVKLPLGLAILTDRIIQRSTYDGIYMEGMLKRWSTFESTLTKFEHLTPEQLAAAERERDLHRERVSILKAAPEA